MKHKHKKGFKVSTARLKDNHTWDAPKGYKIVVLDRGAVSFNVPVAWEVGKTQPFEMHDLPPPKDNVRLGITFWRLPPGIDWTGLPQDQMLADSTKDSGNEIIERGEVQKGTRKDIEVVWLQQTFIDPLEKREAYSRIALARGFDVQALITLDYWVDDAKKFLPAWEEIMRSLQLGRVIADPTRGEIRH